MANNPKKVKDPTEVALSAIQEALNISGDNTTDSARASGRGEAAPPPPPPAPTYDEPTFDMRPSTPERPMFEPIEEPRVSSRRAANDDRETIGQMLQAIQKGRPARSVYTLASLFGVVWLIGCALLTATFWPSLRAEARALSALLSPLILRAS